MSDDPFAGEFEEEAGPPKDAKGGAGGGGTSGPSPQPQPQPQKVRLLPPPSNPMQVAHLFVKQRCLHNGASDALKLRHWRGTWWRWRSSHWVEAEAHAIKSLLYRFTERAEYWKVDENGARWADWAPTRTKIADLLEALSAITELDDEVEQPCWIDGRESGTIVAVANGLLDLNSRTLYEHSPLFFNQTAVPFDYDPDAPEPKKWLEFLDELWPQEPAAIDVLGEWLGYLISGRTDLQKILFTFGPTRGGKGVIGRIERALLGKRNTAGPTLNGLTTNFGLEPLIGKPLGVISDARLGGKDASVVVERLLSISGEDTLTIDRKYKGAWTGMLPTRLHIISNEMLKFADASTAIIGRLVVLKMTRSWLGKEDHDLEPALHKELPGILNYALEGLKRLTVDNDNRFTRVRSSDATIIQMRDLASPTAAFVREKCKTGQGLEVEVDTLYEHYGRWCEAAGHSKASKSVFGRNLMALPLVPQIEKKRPRKDKDRSKKRPHVYTSIDLRDAAEDEDEDDGQGNLL